MNGPNRPDWCARLFLAGVAGALAIAAGAAVSSPARAAHVWVGVGPCCGYGGPGPYYYGYYPPPPYYYAPPPAAYYPAPPAYPVAPAYPGAPAEPAPPAYPPTPAPSAYTPAAPAPSAYAPPGAMPSPAQTPAITYTSKPAFTNASGQTCREYTTSGANGQPVYGTACQQADGQWRVVN